MEITFKILKPETRVVVFDLDGTLYSKRGMVRRMMCGAPFDWRMMMIERNTRKLLRGVWCGDEKSFYANYFQTMAKGRLLSPEYARWWYNNRYMPLMVKVLAKSYRPANWVLPFVRQCKDLGIRLVVLSDYGHTQEKLAALGLEPSLFDWVISAPELGGLKPAPQLLHGLAAKLGVEPHQCFIIGDRDDTDGELARSANCPFYLVSQ